MARFGKWIAGGLGWAFFGPIGGLLGFALGSIFEGAANTQVVTGERRTTTGAFAMSLMVLAAAIMKADSKVLRSELDYAKRFFVQNFGETTAREAIEGLRDLLKQHIPVSEVCRQIKHNLDYSSRLQLLHFLFGIANADSRIHGEELRTIEMIAGFIGISAPDMDSIKHMFIQETDSAYKILEVDSKATNDEVKNAYRKMAKKYHPDKVSHLGEDFQKAANEKFQKVNEAYEKIKRERGIP